LVTSPYGKSWPMPSKDREPREEEKKRGRKGTNTLGFQLSGEGGRKGICGRKKRGKK